jgi:glycosidase
MKRHLTAADLDHPRCDVREEMRHWGRWLLATAGFDGFRLDAAKHIDACHLREWIGDVRASSSKTLQTMMAEQPAKAVTFVECHDSEYGRDYESHVQEWIKPLAYAFILLRPQGYPVVFYPDLYGSANKDALWANPPAGLISSCCSSGSVGLV